MLTDVMRMSQKFLVDNAPTLLATVGLAGVVTTTVLASQAGFRAAYILEEEKDRRADDAAQNYVVAEPLAQEDIVSLTWRLYIPAVASGVVSCACLIAAVYVSNRRTAAMVAAYSLTERAFTEYKHKVTEQLGSSKERALRDEIAQDRVRDNPVRNQPIIQGVGTVLCYDLYAGRYFYSDMEAMRRAENYINKKIINDFYASLSDLYNQLGLDLTKFSDDIGWNSDLLLELRFSTTMADDDRPCIVMDFMVSPTRHYNRVS
jgi:hypothetical protein